MLNNNEKYLLKFISSFDESHLQDNILNTVIKLGIKINFNDCNSVYQIIDELNFDDYVKSAGKFE